MPADSQGSALCGCLHDGDRREIGAGVHAHHPMRRAVAYPAQMLDALFVGAHAASALPGRRRSA
jgi:hypothetical protein